MADSVHIVNKDDLAKALVELNDANHETDWILLEYAQNKNDIAFTKKGTGGLSTFKKELKESEIQFGVVQVLITGDSYSPVKNCLISWLGPKVPPGLKKARAATHSQQLHDSEIIKPIGGKFESDNLAELNEDNVAHALTRISASYGKAATVTTERQAMSKGGSKTSKLTVSNNSEFRESLLSVHSGKNDWVILSYVKGSTNTVEVVKSGGGSISGLKQEYPTDRIYFCVLRLPGSDSVQKFVMLTLVGSQVQALAKARSGGQRQEVQDIVISVVPLHGHYQPIDADDMTPTTILNKFK